MLWQRYRPIPQNGKCYTLMGHMVEGTFEFSFDSSVPTEFQDAIIAGAEEWDKHVGVELFRYNQNVVGHQVSFGPLNGTALAVTYLITSGTHIVDADVTFNSDKEWTTSPNPWIFNTRYDVQAVATHEFGHVLGLDHTECGAQTMFAGTRPEDDSARSPEFGDLAGLRALYGE